MTDIVEPAAWIYPDDLAEMETSETSCTVFSVAMTSPDRGHTVPLYTQSDTLIEQLRADNARLREAATALRDDMLMRAEMNKHRNGGELVVEAGNGVWSRFNDALQETKDDR